MGNSLFDAETRYIIAKERGIIVDECDEWLLYEYTWSLKDQQSPYPYTTKTFNGNRYRCFLHHMIMGYPIDGCVIDHIDRNPKNNSRNNLRYATYRENALNQNRSDHDDLYLTQVRESLWRIQIPIGHYTTKEEAMKVRTAVVELLKRNKFM